VKTRLSFIGVYRVIKSSYGVQGHLKTIKNTSSRFIICSSNGARKILSPNRPNQR